MLNRHFKMTLGLVAVLLAMAVSPVFAQEDNLADDGIIDANAAIVKTELFIWNRFSDLLDTVRCGIALGPGLGFEAAVTNYVQLGAYANVERGVAFPHFIPPLWLVDYYEGNQNVFVVHGATPYATAAFGPWRRESLPSKDFEGNRHFQRDKWDIRTQIDLLLIHLYVTIRPLEIYDFFAGFVGYDPSKDDMLLDPAQYRRPADQFGRGLCNILFGVVEIPKNIYRVTYQDGEMAGLTKGTGLGLWRFFCRECVGVVETLAFPFGWQPIIEPAYVLDGFKNDLGWRVYRPAFHKRRY